MHGGEGGSFPGSTPPNDTTHSASAVGVKSGNSGVVIGYEVDEFTCILVAEHFLALSHIYPGFQG